MSAPILFQEWFHRPLGGTYELQCRRVDGTILETELVLTPVREESGHQIGISAIVRDITDRKRDEEALRQSQERIRLIVKSSLDAVVTINEQGRVTDWNPQAEVIFGWQPAEVIGRVMADFIIPDRLREAPAER